MTSRLVLAYAERHGGREAVEAVLAHAGLAEHEERLNDENTWFTWQAKVALMEAIVAVTGQPDAMRRVGATALESDVGAGLKLAIRAIGSPQLVYRAIATANHKFATTHRMVFETARPGFARIHHEQLLDVGWHEQDCLYNQGLLAVVPSLFGLPPARVAHPSCSLRGGERCDYELHWEAGQRRPWRTLVAGGSAGAALAGTLALTAPIALPVAAVPPVAAGVRAARRTARRRRAELASLEAELAEQRAVTERLADSMRDTVADLRLDEVLEKITHHAQTAVGGKEFALLVVEDGRLRVRSAPNVGSDEQAVLEAWAPTALASQEPVLVDDLGAVPQLAAMAGGARSFGSLCAVPLRFGDHALGVLVAIGHGAAAFLPRDRNLLRLYAAQAAMALRNAHAVERLNALAREDGLTGLLNHRELHERLEARLAAQEPLALVLVDLDRFKAVNDEHGHARGDEVLRLVGRALRGLCGEGDHAYRVGGDEFAIVLAGGSAERARSRAAEAVAAVEALGVGIGASAGVAVAPEDATQKDALLAAADGELYGAKLRGGGDRGAPVGRGPDAAELRAALERDELVVFLQPKVEVRTGRLVGAEALVRWEHPDRGLLGPADFLPTAMRAGLLPSVTLRVLDAALAEVAGWQDAGVAVPVAVNVSVYDVLDVAFPDAVRDALDRHLLDASLLRLEISEDLVMAERERVVQVLRALRALGVELALDDFGTGRASMAYLKDLPLDELKIDRAFVRDLGRDPRDAAIVRSTVALGRALGLRVVAEGVEEAIAMEVLATCGCDEAQGYLLAPPLPAAELRARLLGEAAGAEAA